MRLWRINGENVHDFALSFGRRWREYVRETASGVQIRCLLNARGKANTVLDMAEDAVNTLETWFGALSFEQIHIVQSDYAAGALTPQTGCLWLNAETLSRPYKAAPRAVLFLCPAVFRMQRLCRALRGRMALRKRALQTYLS